jgi:hypothetical protein
LKNGIPQKSRIEKMLVTVENLETLKIRQVFAHFFGTKRRIVTWAALNDSFN